MIPIPQKTLIMGAGLLAKGAGLLLDSIKEKREKKKNQNMYHAHFCKDIDCKSFISANIKLKIPEGCQVTRLEDCTKTAASFHRWLKNHNFEIIEKSN